MLRTFSVAALNEMAQQNFNIFLSLAFCGFGVGMVLTSVLAAVLLGPYGWRGGMLIIGAAMGNIVPCAGSFGSSIRPSEDPPSRKESKMAPDTEEKMGLKEDTGCHFKKDVHRTRRHQEETCMSVEDKTACSQQEIIPLLRLPEELSDQLSDTEQSSKRYHQMTQINHVFPVHDDSPKNENGNGGSIYERVTKLIRESEFYKDPCCNFVLLSTLVFHMTYCGWHVFLIPHALERGISLQHTIIITFCATVGNLIGRLLTGFLTHRLVKPTNVFLIATLINVPLLLCYAFIRSFFAMLFLSFLSAWAILGRGALPVMIIRERASPDNFPIMMAFHDCFVGCGQLLGGYLSGRTNDKSRHFFFFFFFTNKRVWKAKNHEFCQRPFGILKRELIQASWASYAKG